MTACDHVFVVEVGPRDGLQNEPEIMLTERKVELINRLAACGLSMVEATSFVSPKAVPQLADGAEVMAAITRQAGCAYPVLVPNERGYDAAIAAGATHVSVFTAASESFCQRNVNASIAESVERFRPIMQQAAADGVPVRGYISTAWGCPFEGAVAPSAVEDAAARLLDIGIADLSLGDTIGVATPTRIEPVIAPIIERAGVEHVGLHLHDTRGTALANAWEGLRIGIRTFDSSVAGLGGCPFAPGATGNLATEDLVWMLHESGFTTGIDLDQLTQCARWISDALERAPSGHVARARIWPW